MPYFSAKTPATKKKYQDQDQQQRQELATFLKQNGWQDEIADRIASWVPYNQNTEADWFDAEFMFGVKEGFDLVIGNPPYIQLQKDGGKLARKYELKGVSEKHRYQTFARTGDIYVLFYEKGLQSLRSGGHLCFITSNKWMRTGYGKALRKFFTEQTTPKLLIDLGPGVFESATVDTNILLLQRTQPSVTTSPSPSLSGGSVHLILA